MTPRRARDTRRESAARDLENMGASPSGSPVRTPEPSKLEAFPRDGRIRETAAIPQNCRDSEGQEDQEMPTDCSGNGKSSNSSGGNRNNSCCGRAGVTPCSEPQSNIRFSARRDTNCVRGIRREKGR